jgi:phosphohistidine swiveling domain-containing protein
MDFIKEFGDVGKGDAAIAGGKGASLGEMTKAGIPVPPGFVILSDAFERFLEETNLSAEIDAVLHSVHPQEMHTVEDASAKIQALVLGAKMPGDIMRAVQDFYNKLDAQFVAVRSSATAEDSASAAWAGQLDTFLNTTEETLLTNVQKCWASLFTPRAIFYRFEKELHKTKISVAVVVQKMVQSEVSGIAFSVHPVTEDYNQLIIEAGFGLGEAIVSGSVTPDSYVIEKTPRRIIEKNITYQSRALWRAENGGNEWHELSQEEGNKPALTDEQAFELAEIILHIESHYAFPCDIEWAYEAGAFYITQSRPITTLTQKDNNTELDSNGFVWARSYLQSHSFDIKQARASLLVSDILFTSYAEKNCFGESYSPVFITSARKVLKQLILEERMSGLERNVWDVFINYPEQFQSALKKANDIQTQIEAIAFAPEKLRGIDTETLGNYFSSLVALIEQWWRYGSIGEDKGLVVDEKLTPLLTRNHGFSADEAREYIVTMTMPSEQSIFSKERAEFLKLCIEGGSEVEKIWNYADNYFYARSDFYATTALNIDSVSKLIAEQRARTTIPKLKEELIHISENFSALLTKKTAFGRKVNLDVEEQQYLSYFSALQKWLDVRKMSMLKHFTYIFYFLTELSERKGISYDTLSLMMVAEVKKITRGEMVDLVEIKNREPAYFLVYKEGGERLSFTGDDARELIAAIPNSGISTSTNVIRGTIASKGKGNKKIQGTVRVLIDPSKDEFKAGEILVTSMTRPEFVPIMKSAAAIITDEGGIACHAAIVSRELGIACIIGTKFATQILKDGDLVEVDADNGVVRILERK